MKRKKEIGEKYLGSYVYYTANGSKITIEPGKDGVDEEWIRKLKELDHNLNLQNRREEYGSPVRIGAEEDFEGELRNYFDQNPYLADETADPLEILLETVVSEERREKLRKLPKVLDELTSSQKQLIYKKYYLNMSNIAIALEEGVTEGSVRHRLQKIHTRLFKLLLKK